MGTEFIIASKSSRSYVDLHKGPWDFVDWSRTGDALRLEIVRVLDEWLTWPRVDCEDVAARIVDAVGQLPSDRALVSEHAVEWEDARMPDPDQRAYEGLPPDPYRCVGSRFREAPAVSAGSPGMKIQVTPTHDQVIAALAIVWGCSPEDITSTSDGVSTIYEINTDVKGINKAERAIAKLTKEQGE